jgi:hypothetical protein
MDPIVLAVGTALIGAMATDGWTQAREKLVELWRRVRPAQAAGIDEELADLRAQVISARNAGDTATEQALTGSWQVRLQGMLRENPALANELQRLLDDTLTPIRKAHADTYRAATVIITEVGGNAQAFVAREQHFNGPVQRSSS